MKPLDFRLDKISNPETLKITDLDEEVFPFEQFDITEDLENKEILKVARLLIGGLKFKVSRSKPIDIWKYLYNLYSQDGFANDNFYDLIASVLDYLTHVGGKKIDSGVINNSTLIKRAIDATINAAAVLQIKRNPLIKQVLDKYQKGTVETLTNDTVKNVNLLDSNRPESDISNKGNNMNKMVKMMMMSKMMSGDNNKVNPMLLMSMMDKGSNNDAMKNYMMCQSMKSGGNTDAMKMYMMSQMMKKKTDSNTSQSSSKGSKMDPMTMLSMMNGGGGGSTNPYSAMGGTPSQMQTYMMNKMMAGRSNQNNQNPMQNYMMNQMMDNNPQMAMYKAMMQMNNSSNRGRMSNWTQDPNLSDLYNDPELTGTRSGNDHQMEMMKERAEALSNIPEAEYKDGDFDFPIPEEDSICANPAYDQWDGDDEDENGAITTDDDYDEADEIRKLFDPSYNSDDISPEILEMFDTDTEGDDVIQHNVKLESTELTGKEKWVEEIRLDQMEMINKYFNGKVPEGVTIIHVDDAPYFAIPPNKLFSGDYKTIDSLNHYFDSGEAPPASAASLPLTVKGVNKVISILTSDGVRGDIIVPDHEGAEMEIENHIPPKAIVQWRKLKEESIFDDSGNKIEDHVVIMSDEIVGTANSASITANCFALASEDINVGNSEFRPIEYSTNDPVGFYVEDTKLILDKMGADKEIDNISSFVKTINENVDLHPGIKAYIDKKGTAVINDFLLYSMGVNVKVDSFLTDYLDLEDYLSKKDDSTQIDYLRKSQVPLTREICNAIIGEDAENIDIPVITMNKTETIEGEEVTEVVEINGMDFDESLVVFNNRRQITELPWTYDELGLNLIKQLDKADPFVLLTKGEDNCDIYNAVHEITNRSNLDGVIRKVDMVTKDRVTLSIIQSAYDEQSYILVARNYKLA